MIANMIHLASEEKDGGATLYKMYVFIPPLGGERKSVGFGGGIFTKNVLRNWECEVIRGQTYLRCPWFSVFVCYGVF